MARHTGAATVRTSSLTQSEFAPTNILSRLFGSRIKGEMKFVLSVAEGPQ